MRGVSHPDEWGSRLTRSAENCPAKIVELRNSAESTGGRLALFVPAGERLAAEDSFGRSTFEVLDLSDLYDTVIHELRLQLQTLAPELADRAGSVVQLARGDGRFSVAGREAAAFLAWQAEEKFARIVTRETSTACGKFA